MRERGNILFLILLAIVLFAALAYAVTQSLRGGGKDASKESADTFAAQLVQNAGLIESTMTRSMVVDNIKDYGFDVSGLYSASSTNGTCTAAACRIYSGTGNPNGVPPLQVPLWATTDSSKRGANFRAPVVINVGTALPDLVIYYRNLTKTVCDAINANLGIAIDLTVSEDIGTPGFYSGTLTSFPTEQGNMGDDTPTIKGRNSFCMYNSSLGYVFMHVLIPR